MRILYHTHQFNSKLKIYEAVAQEISFLREHFSGPIIQIDREGLLYDRLPGGIVKKFISRLEKSVDLNHIYYPALLDKPYFKFLKKPIIYSVVAPKLGFTFSQTEGIVQQGRLIRWPDKVIVPDQQDVELLKEYGFNHAKAILPGIDLSKFNYCHLPINSEIRLLMASPPWRAHQFEDKGINLLLDYLSKRFFFNLREKSVCSKIQITFLWRNCLYHQMKKLTKKILGPGTEGFSVKIINKIIDPNQELSKIHGAIAVFPNAQTAKAYPHSLIESLAAGKPVIISKNIYMARLIEKENCGVLVEPNLASLKKGIDEFIQNYEKYQFNSRPTAEKYFSRKRLLEKYKKIYEDTVNYKIRFCRPE